MKNFFIALLLLIFSTTYSQTGTWSYVSTLPSPSPPINSMYAVSSSIIWVATASSSTTSGVYLSTNGGTNWVLRNGGIENSKSMYGIFAFDANTALVGSEDGDIYKTTNGGVNWTKVLDLTGSFTDGIYMFNTNYGFYYADPTATTGQPYQIRVTTNGGNNWTLVPNPPISANEYGVINAWDCTDTNHIWVGSANLSTTATSANVYRVTNGPFSNWLTTSVIGTSGSSGCYYQALGFTSNTNGMVGSSGGDLKKTTDGGATYTVVNPPSSLTGTFSIMTMNALKNGSNALRISVSSDTCRIFSTTNFGTTWIREYLPTQGISSTSIIQQIQFLNNGLGFAVTGGTSTPLPVGALYKFTGSSGIGNNNGGVPIDYKLEQNYPNPFNPATTIRFSIPKDGFVTLKVYDAVGKEVETLVNKKMSAGTQEVTFDAKNLNSGVYFYRISTEGFTDTKLMVLVK
jgi:photosystem II stability/assembly factor-like uncharacterized protein